jgi:hypothetical protein
MRRTSCIVSSIEGKDNTAPCVIVCIESVKQQQQQENK